MPGQVDPQSVEYTDNAPSCDDCAFWQDPNACQKVSGPIAPGGWCKLFSAGGGAQASAKPDGIGGPPSNKGDNRYLPSSGAANQTSDDVGPAS